MEVPGVGRDRFDDLDNNFHVAIADAEPAIRQHGTMRDDPPLPHRDPEWLRQDLLQEYYAILDVVSGFDQRVMTIKGWSVTLSLAALGLGFQQGHYALFALGAVTGLGFWLIDAATKTHQMRYYARMRDIELAAYNLNRVTLDVVDPAHAYDVPLGAQSAPRIDMYWSYPKGKLGDWRADVPWRRTPEEIQRMLRRAYWMPHVLLPHAVAIVLGLLLFLGALLGLEGLDHLDV
jgi:hypothetical protein